ncbi:hypothetical protein IJ384_03630 [bacterium]|nr:hypothetical protein [bacterium]
MDRLNNIAFYDFSWRNKYAQNYNFAYKHALQAQNKISNAEHSVNTSGTELEKWMKDLERWKKKTEDYSILAKKEEHQLEVEKQNKVDNNINYLA